MSLKEFNKYYSFLEQLWHTTSIRSYACMRLNDFIIIKSNPSQRVSRAILKDIQNKKDIISTFPPNVQRQVNELKEELNLNQKELQKIKKIVDSMDTRIYDINKEINKIASQVKQESNQEKLIENFRKSYSKFNENISDALFELDSKSKGEVKQTFTQLTDLMNDYQIRL